MNTPTHMPGLRAAALLAWLVFVAAALVLLAGMYHRPSWGALGVLLSATLTVRAIRNAQPRAPLMLAAMVLVPLTTGVLVSLTPSPGAWQVPAIAAAVVLLLGLGLLALARTRPAMAGLVLSWQLLLAIPVDIAFAPGTQGPRVLPLVMGLLKDEDLAAAERAEFIAGGCAVSGLEPRWVLAL